MHNWFMTQTLRKPNDPEWDQLIKISLGEGINPNRVNGFLLAREALIKCFNDRGIKVSIKELELARYHQVIKFPQFTVSLSHTKECGAALIADRNAYRSVGIDIERETRQVKDSVSQRVSHPQDEQLRKIELWCLKEAVFKTLMNTELFEKNVEFSSIQIAKDHWFHSPSNLKGEWTCEIIDSFVVAKAFLKI